MQALHQTNLSNCDAHVEKSQQVVDSDPKLKGHIIAVLSENERLRTQVSQFTSELTKVQNQFEIFQQTMIAQANSFAEGVRRQAEESKMQLQEQLDQQKTENRSILSQVTVLNQTVQLEQRKNGALEQRLQLQDRMRAEQTGQIEFLSGQLHQTELSFRDIENQLALTQRLVNENMVVLDLEREYDGHFKTYVKHHKIYSDVCKKKALIHTASAIGGAVVAGPIGFFAAGSISLVKLVEEDNIRGTCRSKMNGASQEMNRIRSSMQEIAKYNNLALRVLQSFKPLPK